MKLPAGWRSAIDSLCRDVKPFDEFCFRSVELAWAHPDDVISGEGTKAKGGRFAPKGTRAVYASLDEETATREVTARKARMAGATQISFEDYPRLTYVISVKAARCLDFREANSNDGVLNDTLKAVFDPKDLAASQEVGDYLGSKRIHAIVFPSVVCNGANLVVFRDPEPAPLIEIQNREQILLTLENLAKRTTK